MSPSAHTRNQSPAAAGFASAETANAPVSSAPIRIPALSNGASHEAAAGSGTASARTRVAGRARADRMPGEAESRRGLAEGAAELPRDDLLRLPGMVFGVVDVHGQEPAEGVRDDERGAGDLHGDLREERWSAPASAGPATGTSPGPGTKASSGSGRAITRSAGAAPSAVFFAGCCGPT